MNAGNLFLGDGWFLTPFFVLAVSQAVFYRVPQREAFRHFWLLGVFYFFLFAFAKGVIVFSRLLSFSYCEFPLFFLTILILFARTGKPFPQFGTFSRLKIDFYLFSAVLAGIIWFFFIFNLEGRFFQTRQDTYALIFLWSFFPASVFPVLMGIKERLALLDPPKALEGTPVFLIASGIFLSAAVFFWHFIN